MKETQVVEKNKKYTVVVHTNGDKAYYFNNNLNREDGPAIEYANGHKEWYLNGDLHREDGPAIEYTNGYKEWYYQDKEYIVKNNDEFLRLIKIKAFL